MLRLSWYLFVLSVPVSTGGHWAMCTCWGVCVCAGGSGTSPTINAGPYVRTAAKTARGQRQGGVCSACTTPDCALQLASGGLRVHNPQPPGTCAARIPGAAPAAPGVPPAGPARACAGNAVFAGHPGHPDQPHTKPTLIHVTMFIQRRWDDCSYSKPTHCSTNAPRSAPDILDSSAT